MKKKLLNINKCYHYPVFSVNAEYSRVTGIYNKKLVDSMLEACAWDDLKKYYGGKYLDVVEIIAKYR